MLSVKQYSEYCLQESSPSNAAKFPEWRFPCRKFSRKPPLEIWAAYISGSRDISRVMVVRGPCGQDKLSALAQQEKVLTKRDNKQKANE